MIAATPRERSGGASGMLGTARLLGQTIGASLVALFLARYQLRGPQLSLVVGVGFALGGAALSMLRLSPAGARGGEHVRVHDGQRLKGDCLRNSPCIPINLYHAFQSTNGQESTVPTLRASQLSKSSGKTQ